MTMVTTQKTKSGNTVYVAGGPRSERNKAMDYFCKYYNRDFTVSEQRTIGNVWYDIKPQKGKNLHGETIAETGTFTGPDAKKFNPTKKKMVDVQFSRNMRDDEPAIVHEMIHAGKFMRGIPGNKHNEKKIDFEMVGRLSRSGLTNHHTGYYYHPKGNPHLAKKRMPIKEKGNIAKEGVFHDRRLLTGSLNRSITGKVAIKRANRLFPKSFFNQRSF